MTQFSVFKSLVVLAISLGLGLNAMASNDPKLVTFEQVNSLKEDAESVQAYKEAVKVIFSQLEWEGAKEVKVTSDISNMIQNSAICDILQNGSCVVIKGMPKGQMPIEAYYLAVYVNDADRSLSTYRIDIDLMNEEVLRAAATLLENDLSMGGGNRNVIYSQVRKESNFLRDYIRMERMAKTAEKERARKKAELEKKAVENRKKLDAEKSALDAQQIAEEKTAIRNAMLNNEMIDYDLLMKHLPVQREFTKAEKKALEKEANRYYKEALKVAKGKKKNIFRRIFGKRNKDKAKLPKNFKEIRMRNVEPGQVTCYPVGVMERQTGRALVAWNGITRKNPNTKPELKGKGKLLCYRDGELKAKINIEMKRFSVGFGFLIPSGKYYSLSFGMGVAKEITNLISCRPERGKVRPYREFAFPFGLNLEVAYGLGGTGNFIGLSDCKGQRPIIGLFSTAVSKDVLGVAWDAVTIGRIGFDPDDFAVAE